MSDQENKEMETGGDVPEEWTAPVDADRYRSSNRFDRNYLAFKVDSCQRRTSIPWRQSLEEGAIDNTIGAAFNSLFSRLVGPALDEQSSWNAQAVAVMSQLIACIDEQDRRLRQLEERIERLDGDE